MSDELKAQLSRRKKTLERLFYKWGSVKMTDKRAGKAKKKTEYYASELQALKSNPERIEKYVLKGRWKDILR